ncbi:MAG TPA: alpha/beta hydrolase [Mycobacteriales bacterium]|nr:alpha/beta hydrolase [Mycobacteriales bacterium]HWA65745.1 alpha/beta hydrolase [Mycobacteriales bacterium]
MTTYVLVHGGGHGGWCYDKVARLLRDAGHEVHAPSLTGLAERAGELSADTDLYTHVGDVTSLLAGHDLRDVVLVGHSYGGMVITGAADRAYDRVGKLVYLDAANPRNGQSLVDVAGPMMNAARSLGRVVDGVEVILCPDEPGSGAFYGVTDPADLAWMDEHLTPHPWKSIEQPLDLRHEAELWAIPQFHIVCTSTIATRGPELIAKARSEGRLWDIDTGHDLMITEPRAVADALLEIATR